MADFETLPKVVRDFRPTCPGCTPETVTAPDARPCSYYECPGLPKDLEVTCNTCMFDFVAQDGQVQCDHDTCDTALRLKGNVERYKTWVRLIREETARRS